MPSAPDPNAWLDDALRRHPRRVVLRTPQGRELSYAELHDAVARYAAALSARGAAPGERVAVQVDKSMEAVLLYLACLRMGAVFVPINVANTAHEVEYFLTDSQPRVAVVRPADLPVLAPLAQRAGVLHVETLGAAGEGSLPALAGQLLEPDIVLPGSSPEALRAGTASPRLNADSPAALVYTSGTTGRSKGAVLTRGNLASNAAVLAAAWRFTPDDVLLHTLPLYHVHGLFVAINTVLASGSGLLLLPKFDAALVLRWLPEVSVSMGVPTHYTRLLQEPGLDERVAARVRLFVSGSAPLLVETHREFRRRTGHTILERYGMTETLMITSNPFDGPRLPGSVGPALPGVAVRVRVAAALEIGESEVEAPVRPTAAAEMGKIEARVQVGAAAAQEIGEGQVGALVEAAAAQAIGESQVHALGQAAALNIGEVQVKGPNVFAGYWRDAEKTRGAFTADGWFKSGDLGRIDAQGYVYIVGRAKDLVISGGYNVYPKDVETELDALAGVRESAVFGVPHPDLGEGVTAAVVMQPDAVRSEAEIIRAVRARLAGYKTPKRIIFVEELPRNAMGKVQKATLRAAYAALYGVGVGGGAAVGVGVGEGVGDGGGAAVGVGVGEGVGVGGEAAVGVGAREGVVVGAGSGARPAPLKLLSSMAAREVLAELAARFRSERARSVLADAAGGVDVAKRMAGGEAVDVVVLAGNSIDKLIADGKLLSGSRVDLVRSGIAVAVRAGAARPKVDSEEGLRRAVAAAGSLSYSTGPSGVYLEKVFERWGILEDIRGRIVVPAPGVPVGSLVASGAAALGFQQASELMNVAGIEVLGPLPPSIQSITTFSGGIGVGCKDPEAARELLRFMASPAVSDIKRRHGMEPV